MVMMSTVHLSPEEAKAVRVSHGYKILEQKSDNEIGAEGIGKAVELGGIKEDLPDRSERIAWPTEKYRAGEELAPMSVPSCYLPKSSQGSCCVYLTVQCGPRYNLPSRATWKGDFNTD